MEDQYKHQTRDYSIEQLTTLWSPSVIAPSFQALLLARWTRTSASHARQPVSQQPAVPVNACAALPTAGRSCLARPTVTPAQRTPTIQGPPSLMGMVSAWPYAPATVMLAFAVLLLTSSSMLVDRQTWLLHGICDQCTWAIALTHALLHWSKLCQQPTAGCVLPAIIMPQYSGGLQASPGLSDCICAAADPSLKPTAPGGRGYYGAAGQPCMPCPGPTAIGAEEWTLCRQPGMRWPLSRFGYYVQIPKNATFAMQVIMPCGLLMLQSSLAITHARVQTG